MKSTIQMLSLAASAAALTTSSSATKNGCYYNVAGVGNFNYHMNSSADISSSIYTVNAGTSPYARRFDMTNIGMSSGSVLSLTVPGGQTGGPVSSAQLVTAFSDILYGSVRTVAKVSSVPGTTHGFTFYANDTQEVDFAFITGNTAMVHLTNEPTSSEAEITTYQYAAPADATTAFHEYRVDWIPGSTLFYIDSVLIKTITGNVPTTPGFWLWNNWSNGNAWAAGPPLADNVLQIQSIDAYFNRTSVATSIANGAACAVASSSTSSAASSTVKSSSTSSASAVSTVVKAASTSSASSTSVKAASTSVTSGSAVPTGVTSLCPAYDGAIYTDATTSTKWQVNCGVDYYGGDLNLVYTSSMAACVASCASTSKCIDISYVGQACYMKSTLTAAVANSGVNGAYKITA